MTLPSDFASFAGGRAALGPGRRDVDVSGTSHLPLGEPPLCISCEQIPASVIDPATGYPVCGGCSLRVIGVVLNKDTLK